MIWSVSTLLRRSGTAVPVCTVIGSTSAPLLDAGPDQGRQVGGRRQGAADGGRGRDERRHQVGAAALALAALEVAVGRRGAALARSQLVGVHAQAHPAT